MKRKVKFTLPGVNFFFLLLCFSSCLEADFTDITWDENLNWKPDWSVPVGEASLTIENFFNTLPYIDSFPADTFYAYYQDSLYMLNISRIEREEEVEFSLREVASEASKIEYLKLRTIIENGFPSEVYSQIYFYNSANTLIDSLFDQQQRIAPAKVNEQDSVIEVTRQVIEVEVDTGRIDNVFQSSSLLVYGAIVVSDNELNTVTFANSYRLHVKMGLRTRLNIDPAF